MEYSLQIWIAYRSMHMVSVIGINILKLRCSDISCCQYGERIFHYKDLSSLYNNKCVGSLSDVSNIRIP